MTELTVITIPSLTTVPSPPLTSSLFLPPRHSPCSLSLSTLPRSPLHYPFSMTPLTAASSSLLSLLTGSPVIASHHCFLSSLLSLSLQLITASLPCVDTFTYDIAFLS